MVNYSATVQQDREKRKTGGESFVQGSGGKRLLFFPPSWLSYDQNQLRGKHLINICLTELLISLPFIFNAVTLIFFCYFCNLFILCNF